MGKERGLTVRYSFIQGFHWLCFAVVMGFSSVYLLDVGFSNTQIGVLIAVAGIISAILQPVLASYADKPNSKSVKQILMILVAFIGIMGILLLVLYKGSLLLTGLFYGCAITVLQLLTPFVNSLGMETLNQGRQLNYGIARGMGSVTYGVGSYILGFIIGKFGAISIAVTMFLLYVLFFVCVVTFPFEKVRLEKTAPKAKKDNIFAFFVKYKRFTVVLLGCVLIYISHLLLNNYLFQIVESKGGGSSEMGVAMAIAALIELPVLFGFDWMLKKAGSDKWFRISGIFFLIKALGSLFAPNIIVFYVVQLTQIFAWGLLSVSVVYYVNARMDKEDAIKGQAYQTMTYTLGSVLASLFGGALIDNFGVTAMIVMAVAAAALGMLIILVGVEKLPEVKK